MLEGIKYVKDISEYAQTNVSENNIKEILDVIEKVRKYFEEHDINE